jgi:integrating conjugative element protein (TIGR03755 family)
MSMSITPTGLLARYFFPTLFAAVALSAPNARAQTSVTDHGIEHRGNVIGDDVLYAIGGGRAVSMTRAPGMQSLGVGIEWNSNLICGDMSLSTTIRNQLNGITDGFQTIMSSVIQNATAAVASLPALIIQRAHPGLYNLLTNGVLQARLDFDRSKLTCRAIAARMADMAGGQLGWDQLAEGITLRQSVTNNNADAVSAVAAAESRQRGNNGVPWIGGEAAGGTGQRPIRLPTDVVRAGYNLLSGRQVNDSSPAVVGNCTRNLICQAWSSPDAAAAWSTRALGERQLQTCEHCERTVAVAGVGLTPLVQEAYDTKLVVLQSLVANTRPPTTENLDAAGSSSLPITRGVIEALRDDPDQDILARRLIADVALASVIEKALLLQRAMLAGSKEPNVAANQLAHTAMAQEAAQLDREIQNLKTELELRQLLTANAATVIIQRQSARSEASRGVFQGDPIKNRLDTLQRPRSDNP